MANEERKPLAWEALAEELAQANGLSVEDLKNEVRRQLTTRLAIAIVDKTLKQESQPFDWEAAGMTSDATW